MHHPSRPVAAAVLAAAATLLVGVPALAQPAPWPTTTSTTTSSSTTSSTSTSTTSPTEPGGEATSPAKPKGSTTTTTAPSTTTSSTASTTLAPGQVPPEVQAMIDAYPRTPGRRTDALLEVLAPLGELDLKPSQYAPAFGRFPVAGRASYSHDWIYPRHVPDFHVHEGTDVFAERGTPVLAPTAGTVKVSEGTVGGLAVKVVQDDGTYWYLAHLEAVADGIEDGVDVVAGQVVGTVGDSGNAKGGAPHVHVEVHPHGAGPLDPKPLLDQYLDEAERQAPAALLQLLARYGPVVRPLEPVSAELK